MQVTEAQVTDILAENTQEIIMPTLTAAPEQTVEFLLHDTAPVWADCPTHLTPVESESAATVPAQDLDRDAFLLQHLPMVRFVARRIHERVPQHVDLEDLISAGVVGLIDAAAKFDMAKKVQFKSYAQFRVRGAILDSLRMIDWSPRELRRQGRAMAEAIRTLASRLGRTPTDAEIAGQMDMELVSYQQMTGQLNGLEVGSLNAERSEDMGDEELDFLEAPADDNPLSQYMRGQEKQQLVAAIGALPDKERLVLTLYYFEEMTLREIGLTLGVVESRVSQIRSSALTRLRTVLGVPRNSKRSCSRAGL